MDSMIYKAIVVVQVRSNSRRLKDKALLPLEGENAVLVFLLRGLKKLLPQEYLIVVATTMNEEDDRIVEYAKGEAVEIVRGEEDDVLKRYLRCIQKFPAAIVVRVTADNPLTDPNLITKVTEVMEKGSYDYVRAIEGYPVGIGVDAFSYNALGILNDRAKSNYEREHIDAYILNNLNEFSTYNVMPLPELNYPDLRFTIDTYEDYINVKKIIESYPHNHFITTEDAIRQAYKRNI